MGFTGAKTPEKQTDCSSNDLCGAAPPATASFACSGSEGSLVECPFEAGDDVFCAPEVRHVFGIVVVWT